MVSALRLVTFDVTNTLIRLKNSVGFEYMKVMQIYCNESALKSYSDRNQCDNDLSKAFRSVYKEMDKTNQNFGLKSGMSSLDWWTQIVKRTIRLANFTAAEINDKQLDMIAKHLFKSYSSANCWTIDGNSHQVLSALKKRDDKPVIGVISNNDERLEQILRELGLRHYFDFVLTSRGVGFCKPSKEIFDKALMCAQLDDPSRALHIGDALHLDYLSAKSFGWHSLLTRNRSHLSAQELAQIDESDIIDDLSRLLDHKLFK